MKLAVLVYNDFSKEMERPSFIKKNSDIKVFSSVFLHEMDFKRIDSDYTFFLKEGDQLSEGALEHIHLNIEFFHADLFYSDEKALALKSGQECVFNKPDYSRDMILSMNYIGNLLCIKTSLLHELGTLKSQSNANALYEIILAILPKAKSIRHIREILYTRVFDQAEVGCSDFFSDLDLVSAKNNLDAYLKANHILAESEFGPYAGTFRVRYARSYDPLVSIIIPFRDQANLLKACITSILKKSTYQNIEIIGINNGSQDQATLRLMQKLKEKEPRVSFYDLDIPFNYSRLNNEVVNRVAKGEHLILLNNDTEVIEPAWIEAMLEHSMKKEVGVVGAKLLYPDHSIQHCGVDSVPYPRHLFCSQPNDDSGYFYFAHIIRNYHILTFACVMIKRDLFQQVGGLDEVLPVAFNDVDFCARVSALGFHNVYTPYAVLYHYESKSRGKPNSSFKLIHEQLSCRIAMNKTPSVFLYDSFSHETCPVELKQVQQSLPSKLTRPLRGVKKVIKLCKKWVKACFFKLVR